MIDFFHKGEELAWQYLESIGHVFIANNYRTPDRRTEIDLITLYDDCVHFIEVKQWKSGQPLLTQNRKRIAMVRRAASIFLASEVFRSFFMSHSKQNQLAVTQDGTGQKIDVCMGQPLDLPYSVSFDLLLIRDGRFEFTERIF